ncbi:hypothetical protein CBM2587_A20168 [Cupriavidus taiwanensis]|uniref:Uncharacterized protein n=1 Tax=Cupriavidus taiwanensis TaxID=164546 RepID=A0A975WZN0_9BURK|nr:hypothetical protein CBM2587_A20168 [Cupriavidus taiwanensis]
MPTALTGAGMARALSRFFPSLRQSSLRQPRLLLTQNFPLPGINARL